jgi:hypothetical protein
VSRAEPHVAHDELVIDCLAELASVSGQFVSGTRFGDYAADWFADWKPARYVIMWIIVFGRDRVLLF